MARLIFLIVLLVPAVFGQCNYYRALQYFQRSAYEFSIDLTSRINLETESHFVSSTLSAWSLLSSLSLGATDTTLQEIKQVLNLQHHKCFINLIFQIVKQMSRVSDQSTLEKTTALFIDDQVTVKDIFKTRLQNAGVCDLNILSFYYPDLAAATINNFVSRGTHDTIEEIVTTNDVENVFLIMIDVIYFKGVWEEQFSSEDTEASAFYNEKGNQIGDVNLMFVSGVFNTTEVDLIHAKVLELPYKGSKYSMLILLPFADVSVTTVIDSLKKISLTTIFTLFEQFGATNVAVQLPRFKVTSDIDNLKELLTDMGLQSMFDSNNAAFADVSDYQVYVSNFIQKANIEVTEEGITASAVNEATFSARMMPEQFNANKPFLYMIIDRELKIPLFLGAYSKPTLY